MSELDREEQEILATFEAGEWQSVEDPDRLIELQDYAKAAITKDRCITLRLLGEVDSKLHEIRQKEIDS